MRAGSSLVLILVSAAGLASPPEGFLETEPGVRLYWRSAGEGGDPLIVPGGFLFGNDFDTLARERRVIFYDMRNRGRSSRVTDPALLTIEADVRDLEAVRRHFEAERFSTIGYSYLGKMVVLYALEHPDRVERIVQIGPVSMRFGSLIAPTEENSAENVLDPDALAALRAMREAGLHESRPAEYCEQEWLVSRVLFTGDPRNASGLRSWCDLPNEWPVRLAFHFQHHFASARRSVVTGIDVAELAAPVLTVHGTKDRNASYGGGREWAALLPNARLLTVEGAAHHAWVEGPEVLPAIRTFLAGSWPAGTEDLAMASEPWLSQLRAWELLRGARDRIGGEDRPLRMRWSGTLHLASQSRSSSPPFDSFPIRETVVLDRANRAASVEEELQWPGFTSRDRIVARGDSGFVVDLASNRVSELSWPAEEVLWQQLRRAPASLLASALERPASARYLGLRPHRGAFHHLVAAQASGIETTLWLDADLRVRRITRLVDDPRLGDLIEETELDGDRVEVRKNGALVASLRLESAEAVEVEGGFFDRPAGQEREMGAPTALRLEPLAPQVWRLTGIGGGDYASLVIEKGDALVVAEAPVRPDAMREALALIEAELPGRPVKTVVMTHHHFDHSGGVGAALEAGAAIVTTPGNEAFVRALETAPRTLASKDPIGTRVDLRLVREQPLVMGGEGPLVEVHRVDGTGHADEMLVVWLPAERILFQGDLFVKGEPARPQAVALLRRIEELGLDVERIVGVHGEIGEIEDLREAVRLAR